MKFEHEKLQRYEYVEDIGSGGQGKVVKIKEKEKERYYGLKLLKKVEEIEQFKKEVKIMKEMRHKNIVTMHDYSLVQEKGEIFILMEYMKHGNILDYLMQNSQVEIREKLLFIQEIAEALKYVHGKGVIHRDIKPKNIFVDNDGEGAYTKLGDFGIGKKMESETETEGGRGTNMYLPLEVIKGDEEHSEVSDIYGLGMSMYIIMAGRHPCENIATYIETMSNNNFTKPSAYNTSLNVLIDKLCLKSINLKKEKRYKIIEEFIDDLNKCLEAYSIDSKPISIEQKNKEIIGYEKRLQQKKEVGKRSKNEEKKVGILYNILSGLNIMYEKFLLKRVELYTDTKAMVKLGKIYTTGKQGVPKNIDKSITYYQRAIAEGSEPKAMVELGKIYLDGQYIKKDLNKAVHYYFMAANHEHLEAYEKVANFYYKGIVVEMQYKKAQWYYEQLVQNNKAVPYMFYRLGKIYEIGDEVDKFEKARQYYEEGMAKKDLDAMCGLASLYTYGHGVSQDIQKALMLYKKAVKEGKKDALINIGRLYEDGYVSSSPDYVSARYWFMEAEKEGCIEGKLNIADLYEKGGYGIDQDDVKAQECYTSIAESVNANILVDIGFLYYSGERVQKNYSKAIEWYKKAINKGNTECLVEIGDLFFEGGYGVAKDNKEAERYYRQAIERGNVEGLIGLGKVYEAEKMYKRAVGYYETATKAGIQIAYFHLGILFSKGGGDLEKDYKKSTYYYEQYVGNGEKFVLQQLARLYEKGGYGIEKDYKKSVMYYESIKEKGGEDYMDLANLYRIGGHGIKGDYEKAKNYYLEAYAKYNMKVALRGLGDLYRRGGPGLRRNAMMAKECYIMSLEQEYCIPAENLFEVIEQTDLNSQEFNIVENYLERENDKDSLECLGKLYEYGYGTEKNYLKAVEYYEKAFLKGQWRVGEKIVNMYHLGGYGLYKNSSKAVEWAQKHKHALDMPEIKRKITRV